MSKYQVLEAGISLINTVLRKMEIKWRTYGAKIKQNQKRKSGLIQVRGNVKDDQLAYSKQGSFRPQVKMFSPS